MTAASIVDSFRKDRESGTRLLLCQELIVPHCEFVAELHTKTHVT